MILRRYLLPLAAVVLGLGVLAWYWLLHTESGAGWVIARATAATGGALTVREHDGDFGAGLRLRDFRFRNESVDVRLARADLRLDVDLTPLSVELYDARAEGLRVERRAGPVGGGADGPPSESGPGALQLPFELRVTDLAVTDVVIDTAIDASSDVQAAARPFAASRVELRGSWREQVVIDELTIASEDADLQLNGSLGLWRPYAIGLDARAALKPALTRLAEPVDVRLAASGDLDSTRIDVALDELGVTLAGEIRGLTATPAWALALDARQLAWPLDGEPQATVSALHATSAGTIDAFTITIDTGVAAPGFGSARLRIDGHATPERLQLTEVEVDGERGEIAGNVDVALTAGTVAAQLSWQDLGWPLNSGAAKWHSAGGQIDVDGTLDDWRVSGDMSLTGPGVDNGRFAFDIDGDRDAARFRIREGRVFAGRIAGAGAISWRDAQLFELELDVERIATQALAADWPGVLSGSLRATGQLQPLVANVRLADVTGELRNKPVAAAGRLEIAPGRVVFDDFRATHGRARVTVDGELHGRDGLAFDIDVPEIADYVADYVADGAAGDIRAEGRLSLADGAERLNLASHAASLRFGGLWLADVSVESRDGDGVAADLALTINDDLRVVAGVDGRLDDWQAPRVWTGVLDRLQLDYRDTLNAALAAPADVQLSAAAVSLGRVCLDAEADGNAAGNVCVEGSWTPESVALAGTMAALPIELVNVVAPTGFTFSQQADGEFDWRQRDGVAKAGRLDIRLSAGTAQNPEQPELRLQTAAGVLQARVGDGRLLTATVDLPMPGTGELRGDFRVLDIDARRSSAIEGSLFVDIDDVAAAAALSRIVDRAAGSVDADLDISGTVAEPRFVGRLRVRDGEIDYLPIGLELRQLVVDADLHADRHIEVEGRFLAGEGEGRIRSRAGFAGAEPRLQFELQGSGLEIIDVPDVNLFADADLRVSVGDRRIDLDGRVDVPRARIRPKNLGVDRISASDDVVIVGGELPEEARSDDRASPWAIHGRLEVGLGERIEIDVDVAEARITGNSVFSWSGDPLPTANGRYTIGGDIEAFGQVLEITEGSVRFNDVPADNPRIRLRAEREIYGNTQVKRAGVLVEGRAKKLSVEPYTTPLTTEERALTLLVTGSDFDLERGVGAVDFGTYVAPRLFVSYGIGLFDRDNVISARFDLTEGIGIKATSGDKDSGVDLTYRFER